MSVKPTRMELLNTKKKLQLAKKGYKLLKEKRDALMMEFFSTLKVIRSLRQSVAKQLKIAHTSLAVSESVMGLTRLEHAIFPLQKEAAFSVSSKSIMGVTVPSIHSVVPSDEWMIDSIPELDVATSRFRDVLPDFLQLVEKQLVLLRLADEIQKTKRKVNSLEYTLIPRLVSEKKIISLKLEERAREDFTRLKKIKEKLS